MGGLILKFIAPYLLQIVAGVVVLAVVGGGFAIVRSHYINQGYRQAVEEVAADNKEAKGRVNEALSRIDDCRRRGGVWSTVDGVCSQ